MDIVSHRLSVSTYSQVVDSAMFRSFTRMRGLPSVSLCVFALLVLLTGVGMAQKSGPRRPLPKPASGPRGFEQSTGRDAASRLIAAAATRGPLAPVAPYEGLAYDARPMFVWEAALGARSYHFVLRDGADTSARIVYETDVSEPRLVYPTDAPALVPGQLYMWRVSTRGILERKSGPSVTFFVLTSRDATPIRKVLEKLLAPQSATDRLRQARIFAQYGVWYDALRIAGEAVTYDPSDAEARTYYDSLIKRLAAEQRTIKNNS
jgi:hypothetical protein